MLDEQSAAHPALADPHPRPRTLPLPWLAAILFLATLIVYSPALRGGLLWDDAAHITRPDLRSLAGLGRIWFDIGATQQYYPLLHSAFWFEHQLWGDATLGYHLTNILLHTAAAFLLLLILRRLNVPGAFFAALVFALHPVHVESVAWISEQKNTLSAGLYLAAAWFYLDFDETRRPRAYALALILFLLALLTKTVTATLPAALLVIFWWKRGKLSLKRDVLPLLPFFLLAAAMGLLTTWFERKLIGAEGAPFDLAPQLRFLLAGRIVFFYLGKLLYPANLIFIYPRWDIRHAPPWQYLFPLAVLALLLALFLIRRRSRAPLAAALLFIGTLFPVLGFVNVYPFLFSYVADHFQYLACIAIITLLCSAITLALQRLRPPARWIGIALCGAIIAALAILSWRQSHLYADSETLYQTTLARNPTCWLAHNNLGLLRQSANRNDEAMHHYQQALALHPDYPQAHNNLAIVLAATNHFPEAVPHFQEALRLAPGTPDIESNLASAFAATGRFDESIPHYRRALETHPDSASLHHALAAALVHTSQWDEALAEYRTTLRLAPDDPEAHNGLASALARAGDFPGAIDHYQSALRLRPYYPEALFNLAYAFNATGRHTEAIARCEEALRMNPNLPEAHNNLAVALAATGRTPDAITHFETAIRLSPDYLEPRLNLAALLINGGRPLEAIPHLSEAAHLNPADPQIHNTLGLAHIAAGHIVDSIPQFERALQLDPSNLDAAVNLTKAYSDTGRTSDAIAMAQRALHLAESTHRPDLTTQLQSFLRTHQSPTSRP